jgi:phospholipid/cholesterol/gamma-HCH transport system substrate-binding protein
MPSKTPARSVGLFVVITVTIICALILNFSKGAGFWKRGYTVYVRSHSVGGLSMGAAVTMSGVRIGSVTSIMLNPDGRSVKVGCRIEERYTIYQDAIVEIEQSGFLGDQYISVIPAKNEGKVLVDGDQMESRSPFNLQEAARSAVGLMQRLDNAAAKIDVAVERVDRQLLSAETLSNLTATAASFRRTSEKAELAVNDIQTLVRDNAPAVGGSLSNFNVFSLKLSNLADQLQLVSSNVNEVVRNVDTVIESNQGNLQASMENLKASTENVKQISADLQAGKGLAGALLKEDQLAAQVGQILFNVTTVSSNLARFGLLHKPKASLPKPIDQDSAYKGRSPFR